MPPVIRIDDQVMEELQKRAVQLGLVFGTPNEVLRRVFQLATPDPGGGAEGSTQNGKTTLEVELGKVYTPRRWALIPIPKGFRGFFPGYKVPFQMDTDAGPFTTHVTSAPKGTPRGDPDKGAYIQGGLRPWYDKHRELRDGARLRIESLEPGRRYKLSILSPGL